MEIKSIKFTNEHYATAELEVEGANFVFNFVLLSSPDAISMFKAYEKFDEQMIETQAAACLYNRIGDKIADVVMQMAQMKHTAKKHGITIL